MQLTLLKSHPLRHAISIGVVVLVAAYIEIFFSFSHEYWISLTAFFVCQTTRESTGRQGMIVFLICMIAMLAASYLKIIVFKQTLLYLMLSFIFMIGDYVIYLNRLFANKIFLIVIFLLMWLITGLPNDATQFMIKNRVLDMIIGAAIGLVGAQFILPINIYERFRQGVLPILQTLVDYSNLLNIYLKQPESEEMKKLLMQKNKILMALQRDQGSYPEWVYESGFNRELRSGYRFFLVHLEWITEIIVSINYILFRQMDIHSLTLLRKDLVLVMEKNQELLGSLIQYFTGGKIKDAFSDFKNDLENLDKTLKQNIPNNIELLDISPEYVTMTALVVAVKDFRSMLLQLLMTLP